MKKHLVPILMATWIVISFLNMATIQRLIQTNDSLAERIAILEAAARYGIDKSNDQKGEQ